MSITGPELAAVSIGLVAFFMPITLFALFGEDWLKRQKAKRR